MAKFKIKMEEGLIKQNEKCFIHSHRYISIAKDGQAVCDAGLKAHSIDSGLPRVFQNEGLNYISCSDEHGIIEDLNNKLKINDKIFLVPGHCDPTCNLHDWYICVRQEW